MPTRTKRMTVKTLPSNIKKRARASSSIIHSLQVETGETVTIVLKPVGKWIAAFIREVPEVHTQGKTNAEALANAIDAYKEVQLAKQDLARRGIID